jgi:spore coat-associated protein N
MKKIIGLSIAAIIVIALAGVGTFAFFSDTEVSATNTFSAGTLDLKVSNDSINYADGVTTTWGGTNLSPGAAAISGHVDLKNAGTVAAQHTEVKFTNTVTNAVTPTEIGADDLDISTHINVQVLSYDGTDLLAYSAGQFTNSVIQAADLAGNHDGKITLNELNSRKLSFTNVPTPNGAAVKQLLMTVQLDSATGNGNQGDSVTTLVDFGLFQDASQTLP